LVRVILAAPVNYSAATLPRVNTIADLDVVYPDHREQTMKVYQVFGFDCSADLQADYTKTRMR
jgi:hypothetical protein